MNEEIKITELKARVSTALHFQAGQQVAACPHCGGELSKKTPVMAGDESEEIWDRSAMIAGMKMATDPRPKCPHCYGRFELVIHFCRTPRPTTVLPTKTETAPHVGSSALLCPVCGEKTQPKAYGPFFTPDPVHRVAMTCPHDHWRGRMCATRREAEGHDPIRFNVGFNEWVNEGQMSRI